MFWLLRLLALCAWLPIATRAADEPTRGYDLRAADAATAFRQFSDASGYQILFAAEIVRGVRTSAVQGEFTALEALERMLKGTNLHAVEDKPSRAFAIRKRSDSKPAPPPPARKAPKTQSSTDPPAPPTQEPMKRNRLLTKLAAALAVIFAFASPADAQTAPASNGDPNKKEETIELSPFVVSTDQDVGYLAGNTLAGSRLNTSLKDAPAAISVLTSEFISDIGAFDISEALAYTVNTEFFADDDRTAINGNATVANFQTYRVRGMPASRARNYFQFGEYAVPSEAALIERIEDARGPNSILFGMASPGGLINAMTKQSQPGRAFQKASFSVMSYDSYRGAIDLNQPLMNGKLAVRLNAVYNETNTFRLWQYQEHKRVHLAAKYILTDRTRIRAEFERGQIDSNAPRNENLHNSYLLWDASGRPTSATQIANKALGIDRLSNNANRARFTYIANDDRTISMRGTLATSTGGPWGSNPITDTSIADRSININGPDNDRTMRFNILTAFLEHQISDRTFLELAYNHLDSNFDRFDPRRGKPQRLKGDPNQFLNDGTPNPHAGQLYLETTSTFHIVSKDEANTGRATLSTELDAGKWGNYRIAGMAEYEETFRGTDVLVEQWVDADTGLPVLHSAPENAANRVFRRTYVTEGDWDTYHVSGGRGQSLTNVIDPVTGRALSTARFRSSPNGQAETYRDLTSFMAVVQARHFDDRLVTAIGYRRDDLDIYEVGSRRNPVTNEWEIIRDDALATNRLSRSENIGDTKTVGFVYHTTPWLSLFYNQSDNISLPAPRQRLPDSGEPGNPIPVESPMGETQDYGLALTLLDGRLYARATYYDTGFVGQSTTSPSVVRAGNTRIMEALLAAGLIDQAEHDFRTDVGGHGLFDFRTEGIEVQVTANMTENWRLQVNYAYTDSVTENLFNEWKNWHELNVQYLSQFPTNSSGDIVDTDGDVVLTSSPRTIAEEVEFYLTRGGGLNDQTLNDGQTKLGNRHHKFNFFTRYNFSSGWLRGAYVGGGYRYQSAMFTGLESEENRRELWTDPIGQADLLLGYTVRGLPKGRRLSFQLNIFNLFDEQDPIVTRYDFSTGEQRISAFKPREPLTWRFTTNFEF